MENQTSLKAKHNNLWILPYHFICSIAEDESKENDTHNNLQLLREAHHQNIKPHGS